MTYIPANKISAQTGNHDVGEILRVGLDEFLEVAVQNAQLYVRHHNPEALHQYRVALRQARSLLKTNSCFIPAEQLQLIKHIIKSLTEPTGKLRDLEVFIEHLKGYSEILPKAFSEGARHMQNDLHWEANKYRQKILSWFLSDGFYCLKSDLDQNIRRIEIESSEDYYNEMLATQIKKQQKKISTELNKLDVLPVEGLHRLRIMVKNQRYTASFYPELAKSINVKIHKKVQTDLGLIHDYAMQRHFIMEYIDQKQQDERNLKQVALFVGALTEYLGYAENKSLRQLRSLEL